MTTEYRIAMAAVEQEQDFHTPDHMMAFTFVNEEQYIYIGATLEEHEDFLEQVEDRLPDAAELMTIQSRECSEWTAVA